MNNDADSAFCWWRGCISKREKMVSLLTNWIFQTFDEFKKSLKTALLCSQRRHSLPQFNSFMSKAKSLGSQCRSFNKIRLVLEVIQTSNFNNISAIPWRQLTWLIDWYLTPTLTIFQLYLGVRHVFIVSFGSILTDAKV
jgi:hypothetical protein